MPLKCCHGDRELTQSNCNTILLPVDCHCLGGVCLAVLPNHLAARGTFLPSRMSHSVGSIQSVMPNDERRAVRFSQRLFVPNDHRLGRNEGLGAAPIFGLFCLAASQ